MSVQGISSLNQAIDYLSIVSLLNSIALAQDELNWKLFKSCWGSTSIEFDMTNHLAESYPQPVMVTATDMAQMAHLHLAGFEGTQHVVSNIVVEFDPKDENKALVQAYVNAYHFLTRPDAEGDGKVLVRGRWVLSCEKMNQQWKGTNFGIRRLSPAEGDEKLYDVAKGRAEKGEGRKAKTGWE